MGVYPGSIVLAVWLSWLFSNQVSVNQRHACEGYLTIDHNMATTKNFLGVVTLREPPRATMCWNVNFVNHPLESETIVVDDGIVRYVGPLCSTISTLESESITLQVVCELAALISVFVILVALYCKGNYHPWIVVVGTTLMILSLVTVGGVLWTQPNYQAAHQFQEATQQRAKGIQLLPCLHQPLFQPEVKKDNHWFSQTECVCHWRRVALGEIMHNELIWSSMAEFHKKSMFAKPLLGKHLLQHPTGPHLVDIHAVHHKILAFHDALDQIIEDERDEIIWLEKEIQEAKNSISSFNTMAWLGPGAVLPDNTTFLAHTAAQMASSQMTKTFVAVIHENEKKIKHLRKKIIKKEQEQQLPLVNEFLVSMQSFSPFLSLCFFA